MDTPTRTTNLPAASAIDEVIGNETSGGVYRTKRVPVLSLAAQIAGTEPLASRHTSIVTAIDAMDTRMTGAETEVTGLTVGLTMANAEIAALNTAVAGGAGDSVVKKTWTELDAITGTRDGQSAIATSDGGEHLDPVSGVLVPNTGQFSWSVADAGWERVADIINAVWINGNIEAVNGKVDGLLGPVTRQQTIGASAPDAGSASSSAGTYVWPKEAEFDGVASKIRHASNVAATIEVGIFTRSDADLWTQIRSVDVPVIAGVGDYALKLPVLAGQYMGVTGPAGAFRHNTVANHGFYYAASLTAGAFSDTTISNTVELQTRFTIDQVDTENGDLVTGSQTISKAIGVPTTPVSGGGLAAGTVILNPAFGAYDKIRTVSWHANAAAPVTIGYFKRTGLSWTMTKRLRRVTTRAGALNVFNFNTRPPEGEYLGFQSAVAGWATSQPVSGPGYFYSATHNSTTVITGGLNTVATLQIQADILRVAKPRHEVRLADIPRVLVLGPSYAAGHYNPQSKNWVSKVSQFIDWNVENYSFSGNTLDMLMDRWREGIYSAYAPVPPAKFGVTYGIIMEGWNSENDAEMAISFDTYTVRRKQMIEIFRSFGIEPILATEWQPVYGDSAHASALEIAEDTGARLLNLIPHSRRMAQGTPYNDFWQGPTDVRHPGVRTNHVIADPVERFIHTQIGRPATAKKLFRKRSDYVAGDISALMYRDSFERAERWVEIATNHVSLSPSTVQNYDALTTGTYDQNYVTQSEYLLLQDGGTIACTDEVLLEVIFNSTLKAMDRVEITLSDTAAELFVKDALLEPYATGDGSVSGWRQLTGTAGVFTIDRSDLVGKVYTDKMSFVIRKAGAFTLAEPKVVWWGDLGKPDLPAPLPARARGERIIGTTKFDVISGDKTTGWAAIGALTKPEDAVLYQLPFGITDYVYVDATNKAVQRLTYAVDNYDDRLAQVMVTARRLTNHYAPSGTYPTGSPITVSSFDWRRIVLELVDPDGMVVAKHYGKIGLWWDEVPFTILLPVRVGALDIRISGSDVIELAEVDVRLF